MTAIVVFEDDGWRNLLPLTYWRTTCELRTGYGSLLDAILTCTEATGVHLYCRPMLAAVTAERFAHPVNRCPDDDAALLLNGRLLMTAPLAAGPRPAVQWHDGTPIVIQADRALMARLSPEVLLDSDRVCTVLGDVPEFPFIASPRLMNYPWDLVHANVGMLHWGWERTGRSASKEGRLCPGVHLLEEKAIHIGAGSVIKPGVVLDAENGPIYIGDGVTVAPNVSIEGPCYIGDGSIIQPGAALRDAMSIGRRCKVGGELEASIVHGYSNKQHDGFLGHAYVAEWVNLAADTVNSDLKNTYGSIRVPINGIEVESGQMFVGLTIGDHSKTGIGQMFPTGAVMGFGSNVATCEFAPKFVPSFSWLTNHHSLPYRVDRCLDVARRVMARRQVTMTRAEEALFRSLPELAQEIEVSAESSARVVSSAR